MKALSHQQVQYIRDDIKRRGVTSSDLLDQLTDHLACIIEDRGFDNGEFYTAYASVVKEFIPGNFQLIQKLTDQLITKKSTVMKITRTIALCFLCYAAFVMILSFALGNARDGEVLRSTGYLTLGTSVLIYTWYFIRYKTKSLNLRIIEGLVAYGCCFLLMAFALKELNASTGKTFLDLSVYVLWSITVLATLLYFRYRSVSSTKRSNTE
jgi:hypothetical protein